jgi:acyl CoA:acetate/3-ketoacid CoA transferase
MLQIFMSMSIKKDRVNIAVSKDVADLLANTAEELGMTQYALANQILEVGLELIREGYGVAQIREIAKFYKVMTELESVPVPGRLLDRLIVEMYRENPEVVARAWCEAGRMLAAYIKAIFGGLEEAVKLVPHVAKAVPARRFEVKTENGEFFMDTIGVGYSLESVQATASAVKCLLEELNYEVKEVVTAPGILRVKATKK